MNRANNTGFANWWFTVDRVALLCMLALAGIGLMLAFAASPAITGGPLTAGDFRYTARQVLFAGVAIGILCGVSLLILIKQPDVGQTGLLLCLWGAMLFFYGVNFLWIGAGLGGVGVLGFLAY